MTPTIPKPKDSGVREQFDTGSRRDTRRGKGRYDLLPTRALELVAIHFENGSEKYGDRNWEKGQPLSRYLDSALRHIFKHLQGLRDEPHAIAAVWNLLCLIETERRIAEGILPEALGDLPQPTKGIHDLLAGCAPKGDEPPLPPLIEEAMSARPVCCLICNSRMFYSGDARHEPELAVRRSNQLQEHGFVHERCLLSRPLPCAT